VADNMADFPGIFWPGDILESPDYEEAL